MPPTTNRAAFYDPNEVAIYFNGVLIQGFADGEYISVEHPADDFDEVVGTDGEVARSKTNDRRIKVTVKLLQTSLSNAKLTAISKTDRNAPNGAGVGTFSMQDLSSLGTVVSGEQSWIKARPGASFDRTAKSREWVFTIAAGEHDEMGN